MPAKQTTLECADCKAVSSGHDRKHYCEVHTTAMGLNAQEVWKLCQDYAALQAAKAELLAACKAAFHEWPERFTPCYEILKQAIEHAEAKP